MYPRSSLLPLLGCTAAAAGLLFPGCGGSDDAGGTATRPAHAASAAAAKPSVVVPQVVGLQQDKARRRATRAGVVLKVVGYAGKYGNGRYNVRCVKVFSQSPVAGERRPKGASISVLIKECKTPTTGPVPPAGTT